MNAGEYSVKNSRVTWFGVLLIFIGGIYAYSNLGRLEDPEFTIKDALIITPYPGASAEEVAKEVTNPIELAVQQLGQLDSVESESTRGRSVVIATIKDQYTRDAIPQVWDELRRKVADAQSSLPPSARGTSIVIDDFGDVYGVFLAITGDGFTYPELRRYADFLRRELLLVQDVKKVDLFAEQNEVVFLEISRKRLALMGINEEEIYRLLRERNVAADGGRIKVGEEYIAVDPRGAFESADDMLNLVIGADRSGKQLFLRDVAEVDRSYQDPPRRIMRFDGRPAIGIGISTVQGGNVVVMGKAVREKLDQLKREQPVGITIGEVNFQPEAVSAATGEFIFNLGKAVTIVFVVLLIAMGLRAGAIIGGILFLTIMGTFLVMFLDGDLLMQRISLGALIIALCMLTDNAIVITEVLKVRIEQGEDRLEVVKDAVAQNQWPLFGATGIAVVAFAAIGLSEHSTGEYANSLFWVIFISLALSWVTAITATPLLCYLFFKPLPEDQRGKDPYAGFFFQGYKKFLIFSLRFRYLTLAVIAAMFVAAVWGFGRVDQNFFPPATRPQFMIDCYLPAGTHIRESDEFARRVGSHIQTLPSVKHVTSFVGSGGLRFILVYSPERENRAFVQFLVEVEDEQKIAGLIEDLQDYLDKQHPDANTVAKKFLLGPGQGGRVQARLLGPDPAVLRQLADKVLKVIEDDGGAVCVRSDWREPEKVIRPAILDQQAARNGLTRVDIARALEAGFEGRTVGLFREPGNSGRGVYPQEARFLPIVARPPLDERSDAGNIENMQVWSPVARRMIPLSQVISGTEVVWEDPVVMRQDRFPTITVHADPRTGLPSQLFNRVRSQIEAIELPAGYTLEWGGEHEDSTNARAALAQSIPATILIMVFIVVWLFNSMRATLVICMAVPLAIIGVTAGLLIIGVPFGFMALLGVIALVGELIKNAVVLVDEIFTQRNDLGKPAYTALLDASVSRLRPVLLVAVTTVLGMIPLLQDPFFVAMAACIMFGLAFACVLTMIVVPIFYAILFRVTEKDVEPQGQ